MANDTKSGSPDSAGTPGTEDADKGKSLSDRLDEFEKATRGTAASKTAPDARDKEIAELKATVERLSSAEADRSYRREMDTNLIPAIKGDLDVHPKHVERWLNEQAASDPRLMKAWENREEDPDAFKAAIEKLAPAFKAAAEEEGLLGTGAPKPKDDGKRKAAVRSARQTQSDARDLDANLGEMSDTEFAMHKQEVFRLAQAGQLTQ